MKNLFKNLFVLLLLSITTSVVASAQTTVKVVNRDSTFAMYFGNTAEHLMVCPTDTLRFDDDYPLVSDYTKNVSIDYVDVLGEFSNSFDTDSLTLIRQKIKRTNVIDNNGFYVNYRIIYTHDRTGEKVTFQQPLLGVTFKDYCFTKPKEVVEHTFVRKK